MGWFQSQQVGDFAREVSDSMGILSMGISGRVVGSISRLVFWGISSLVLFVLGDYVRNKDGGTQILHKGWRIPKVKLLYGHICGTHILVLRHTQCERNRDSNRTTTPAGVLSL